ncbi:hypothetical protein ASPVEDRAFT_32242 [Aspergillus versicolor CBS 583.65]|uniref:N-acetyltransferase domain-containing protein n=1 Tax=Aspergillus versicolor CBS 583.65 TaxID=1036611 RepID=A0A1L9PWI0_ASPVE|nr:uncharacterized protein ASPVEDRAFT_32242 [Aspergillus versicolor CBS 583.65]OJJ05899.1 hypothetical protein ASPVEDRAFT_32242 [Aspergillus versicolor CBS 583.65]
MVSSEDLSFPEQVNRVVIPHTAKTIFTKRLILRPLSVLDAEALFQHRSRQDVAEWLWPQIAHRDVQETRDSIAQKTFQTPDANGTIGLQFSFAIVIANDPNQPVIGALGINALHPAPSIGYCTHPDTWGKGYASEAVAGLVEAWWSLPRKESLQSERLFSGCKKSNLRSCKVLFNNGFKVFREVAIGEDTALLFDLEKPAKERELASLDNGRGLEETQDPYTSNLSSIQYNQ